MNSVLLTAGVASIILAVVGGGAQAFGVTVPVLNSPLRQAGLGFVGIAFLVIAVVMGNGHTGTSANQQKAREIQSSLVQEVREAVDNVLQTGESLASRTSHGNSPFQTSLREWNGKSDGIQSQLETYFPQARLKGTSLPSAWNALSRAVDDLYFLGATGIAADTPSRCFRTKRLMTYLGLSTATLTCPNTSWPNQEWKTRCLNATTSWDALAICDSDSITSRSEGYLRGANYIRAYKAAREEVRAREEPLLDRVRNTTPVGF